MSVLNISLENLTLKYRYESFRYDMQNATHQKKPQQLILFLTRLRITLETCRLLNIKLELIQ